MGEIDGTHKNLKQNKSAKLTNTCVVTSVETSEVSVHIRIQLLYSQLYSSLHFLLRYEQAQVTSSSVSSLID